MKPTLTRTFAKDYTEPKGRLAITLNAWVPAEIDPTEDELRLPLEQCLSLLERTLFHIQLPEPPKPECCRECRFFQVTADSTDMGLCRCHPPAITDRPTPYNFPGVMADDWCGEFQRLRPQNADRPSVRSKRDEVDRAIRDSDF